MQRIKYHKNLAVAVSVLMDKNSCGHDFEHVKRVCALSQTIVYAEDNSFNREFIEALALCHDLCDWKVKACTPQELHELLLQYAIKDATRIVQICSTFGYSHVPACANEAVVKDADALDAIGAVGIARAFAYGGANHMTIYDPSAKPNIPYETGKNSPSILTLFEEKLLHLDKRMHTETARRLAERKMKLMKMFYNEFLQEFNHVSPEV